MTQPYLGEIRLLPYPRGAPIGWHLCDGSLISVSDYNALFTLLGTIYGGDGSTTFGLPDLRGSVPIHQGTGPGFSPYALGQKGGAEQITLTTAQMPPHGHAVFASTTAASSTSINGTATVLAAGVTNDPFYAAPSGGAAVFLAGNSIQYDGGSQPHDNCAATLTLNYCIALLGIFPSRS